MVFQSVEIREPTEENPLTPYEKQILRMREYRKANKDKVNKYRRQFYKENKDTIRAYSKEYMNDYYDKNPDKRIKHNDYMRERARDKVKSETDEEKTKKIEIRNAKKSLRLLLKEQAYNNSVIQSNNDIETKLQDANILIASLTI
tara:strand:+ start:338 stop:772 length:435 start_codon:yes stop_codon:yes gene_type:complete